MCLYFGDISFFCGEHKLETLISFYMPSSCAISFSHFFFYHAFSSLYDFTTHVVALSLCLSLVLSPFPLSAGRQPARSFTLSDSVMHPAGQRLDDVIWAKGCVNTAVTLVLDL